MFLFYLFKFRVSSVALVLSTPKFRFLKVKAKTKMPIRVCLHQFRNRIKQVVFYKKENYIFWGQGKSTYMFSTEHLPLSAPPPACWLYPLKPGGERKAEDVRRKKYTLIYLDPIFCFEKLTNLVRILL